MRNVELNLIRGPVVKARVTPLLVVESEPSRESMTKLAAVVKTPQVQALMFNGPPQSFDKKVILNPAATIHADLCVARLQRSPNTELRPSIGIK